MNNQLEIKCIGCNKTPDELQEYKSIAKAEGYESATQAVMREEGTYNPRNGHFYCTSCYIKEGMPSGVAI